MHVVAYQSDVVWEDREKNLTRLLADLSKHTISSGSLIVLPEMFDCGFTMNVSAAVDTDGGTRRCLSDLARAHQSMIVAGIVRKHTDGKGLNQAVVFSPNGDERARYTKMHSFTPAGEHEYYRAGESVVTFKHADFTISPFICYDLRFPERFREAVRLGAEVFIIIASWPGSRAAHWSTLLASRAIENQAYVIGVNRVGRDPNHEYVGLTTVIDPTGRVLAQADDQPTVLHADLDREALLAYRRSFPVLEDMRGK